MTRKLIVLALLAMAALPAMAQTTATTNVNMNLPSFVFLYYRGTVTFNLTEANLATALMGGGNPFDEGATSIASLTGDAGVTAASYNDPAALVATVTNFWAVRSLATAPLNTQVSVSFPVGGDTLSNGTDTITLANVETDTSGGGFGSSSVSFPPTGLAIGAFQLGDVQFDVDMSAVSTDGSYTGGAITISAQNL